MKVNSYEKINNIENEKIVDGFIIGFNYVRYLFWEV